MPAPPLPTVQPEPQPTPTAPRVVPIQPSKIPVSVYPPLALERPLSVFGPAFKVHLSASATLSPDTVMQASLGTGVFNLLRAERPADYQNLKKLLYIGAGKHRPSETTRQLLELQLQPVVPPEALKCIFNGDEPPDAPPHSDWDLSLRGMVRGEPDLVRDIANGLAAYDHEVLQMRALHRAGDLAGTQAALNQLLGDGLRAWISLNPLLATRPEVVLLVDSSLQVLSTLICSVDAPSVDLAARETHMTSLMAPGHRPLGHWLTEVRSACDCRTLAELSQRLLKVDAKHLQRPISHDLLKKWSSSQKVAMPRTALQPVLSGVRLDTRRESLNDRFFIARFLTFLCDLVFAATPGEAPLWPDCQAQVRERFVQIYRWELARRGGEPAPGQAAP
jgi:hypothetical protein